MPAYIAGKKAIPMRFDAVLFDCDGVLADSEPITMRVLRDMLAERGWAMPLAECTALFVGVTVRSRTSLIELRTGKPLTDEWMADFYAQRDMALREKLRPIAGAAQAVRAAHRACGGRIACASGADAGKLRLQLGKLQLAQWFVGRVFSGHEVPRNKPFPDVYLAAARALDVPPARCLVIEDTPTGVRAGKAAGAAVWAYAPKGCDEDALRAAGADALLPDMALLGAHLQEGR